MEIITRSQSTGSRSKSSIYVGDKSLRSDTWNLSGTQGNVFDNPQAVINSSWTPHQGILHSLNSLNQSATSGNPVQKSTGKPVVRSEEQNRDTIPTPRFARKLSTMNSFFPPEGPQNYMADQQRLQISELHFDKIPIRRFKTQVSACSGFPSEAMLWIQEVEMVDSVDDLKSSRSIQDYTHFLNFEMLDARIAFSLNKIM